MFKNLKSDSCKGATQDAFKKIKIYLRISFKAVFSKHFTYFRRCKVLVPSLKTFLQ